MKAQHLRWLAFYISGGTALFMWLFGAWSLATDPLEISSRFVPVCIVLSIPNASFAFFWQGRIKGRW